MAAQDDEERFDLYTRDGASLGLTKARRDVHRDGDWHRSVHIWVWGLVDGAPHLVFQRRSAGKDTWPGRLDVAVTGHARAGETLEATLREAEEEIGLAVRPEDLVRLGLRRRMDARPGVKDNELQDILARRAPADLRALRPDPDEVSGLLAVAFADAGRVLAGGSEAPALSLVVEEASGPFGTARVSSEDFVPASDGYYMRAHESLAVLLAGGTPAPWEMG